VTQCPAQPHEFLGLCRARRRALFSLYAALTVTLTHWPRLKLPFPESRSDLLIHMTVFSLWTAAFIGCSFLGPVLSRRNILLGGLASVIYSSIDEVTQGIPGVNRTVALDDALANALGVALAVVLLLLLARRPGNTSTPSLSDREGSGGARPKADEQ